MKAHVRSEPHLLDCVITDGNVSYSFRLGVEGTIVSGGTTTHCRACVAGRVRGQYDLEKYREIDIDNTRAKQFVDAVVTAYNAVTQEDFRTGVYCDGTNARFTEAAEIGKQLFADFSGLSEDQLKEAEAVPRSAVL